MNISNLLHPEIIHDTRGPLDLRQFYKLALKAMRPVIGGGYGFEPSSIPRHAQDFLSEYANSPCAETYLQIFGVLKRFLVNRGRTYYIPREFLQALSKVDRETRLAFYPERFCGYFAFPKQFVKAANGGHYNGVYVDLSTSAAGSGSHNERNVQLIFPVERDSFTPCRSMILNTVIKEGESLSDMAHEVMKSGAVFRDDKFSAFDFTEYMSLIKAVLNALLYVHNESDELTMLRPATNPDRKNGKPVETSLGRAVNNCSLQVRLLSFNYHNHGKIGVESTSVRGHFRWQPHGPGMAKIKLIWIDPHIRCFGENAHLAV